ncbi:MAG TPA: zinc ribbon domain-containing protein [Clostridiales bacterium]|nr:zinc ribbon domain-containing protein [Clostridiales bacterium]
MYCRNCGNGMDDHATFCVKCGVATGTGNGFCPNCGTQSHPQAVACVNCGFNLGPAVYGEQKSKLAAGLLGIFLGGLGIHNFYLGYQKKAITQLLICVVGGIITCGIAAIAVEIWGLVEGIMILSGNISVDGKGIPLKE